jgi:8-oxo-dGTP pyrophosphatase MutT (NUDIX family)
MSLKHYRTNFIREITFYIPYDAEENEHRLAILTFAGKYPCPFSREIIEGHVTASAILASSDLQFVLLLWHQKIQRWLQPGGHCDLEDSTVQHSALRELTEETGVSSNEMYLFREMPFDLDVHEIKSKDGIPTHKHYDVVVLESEW